MEHATNPSVLHVLPHPGGGGQTYADTLDRIRDYRFGRVVLQASESGEAPAWLMVNAARANLAARHHDLVHVHGEAAAFFTLPAIISGHSVFTAHGLNLVRRVRGTRRRIAECNLRTIVRRTARTIAVSEVERDDFVAIVGDRLADKITLIRNGVDIPKPTDPEERRRARAEFWIEEHEFVAVFVGSVKAVKDPLTAARAAVRAAEDAPVVILFAGDGDLRPDVEELARDANGAVRLLGSRRNISSVLAAADAFVLPSRHEGLPYALLEAMAHGLPTIVSDRPGCMEVVGDAGIVVPGGDMGAFADAFRRLIADPGAARALGERARQRVAATFSADEQARRTCDVYDAVLSSTT
ncbi:MAG: glycosyltransferase family 4 protein [Actinomycetes bacterium]